MNVLRTILLILHFLGLASLLGGILVQLKEIASGKGKIINAILHGAVTQLVTGLLLVAIIEIGDLTTLNNYKVGLKTVITVVIVVLVFVYRRRKGVPAWILWTIGGLALANVIIAAAWH